MKKRWVKELDVTHLGHAAHRTTTGLLETTAGAAESLQKHAKRLQQLGGEEKVLWLTAKDGPDGVPLDMKFLVNDWTSL